MNVLATNKRASFDYELLDRYEAGLMLTGAEVKSAKMGHMSLKGSFVTMHGGELYLTNASISPYKFATKTACSQVRDKFFGGKNAHKRLDIGASSCVY